MNAHRTTLDSAPALIDRAASTMGRIARLAVHTRPNLRLRLMGELSLMEQVIETVEAEVVRNAERALTAARPMRALPAPRCASPKRLKAGRAP